jgi:hypothetical protein
MGGIQSMSWCLKSHIGSFLDLPSRINKEPRTSTIEPLNVSSCAPSPLLFSTTTV